jgi:site-specific recombinase XerC
MSSLRRQLLGHVGDVPLAEPDRATLVEAIAKLEEAGMPGAATVLRAKARTFMGWVVDSGLLPGNPLAGWRKPRSTRAERLDKPKRSLANWEIPVFWRACEDAG